VNKVVYKSVISCASKPILVCFGGRVGDPMLLEALRVRCIGGRDMNLDRNIILCHLRNPLRLKQPQLGPYLAGELIGANITAWAERCTELLSLFLRSYSCIAAATSTMAHVCLA